MYRDSYHISMSFKKTLKLLNFLYSHFNIEDGRKCATFSHIILYYFKQGKNATEMQKDLCTVPD